MRFHYPLQKIVDLRTNQRTQAEWVLSEAMNLFQQEQETQQRLYEQLEGIQHEMDQVIKEASSISKIQLLQENIIFLQNQLVEQQERVKMSEQLIGKSQQNLTNKMQDEKVWTTTKDKAHVRFVSNLLKKEQQEMDEMAGMRHLRA